MSLLLAMDMEMESDKQNFIERSDSVRVDNTLPLVFSFIVGLFAVIALVLGAVSLSQNGTYNYNIGTTGRYQVQ